MAHSGRATRLIPSDSLSLSCKVKQIFREFQYFYAIFDGSY